MDCSHEAKSKRASARVIFSPLKHLPRRPAIEDVIGRVRKETGMRWRLAVHL
jgi:hypothetical protein